MILYFRFNLLFCFCKESSATGLISFYSFAESLNVLSGSSVELPSAKRQKLLEQGPILIRSPFNSIKEGTLLNIGEDTDIQAFLYKRSNGADLQKKNFYFILPFYKDLLEAILSVKTKKVVLLGNPGIGKSMYIQYILMRILRQDMFGQLPDALKQIRFIAYQYGDESLLIYDLATDMGSKYTSYYSFLTLLQGLDHEKSLYLFDSTANVNISPHYSHLSNLRTIATLSPQKSRYKEFLKEADMVDNPGGLILYMPVFYKEELLRIARFLRELVPSLMHVYSEDIIRNKYWQFGGIFRYIFAEEQSKETFAIEQQEAIAKADAKKVLELNDISNGVVSHHLLHYMVPRTGKDAFFKKETEFSSAYVYDCLKENVAKLELDVRIQALKKNDRVASFMALASREIYESVIYDLLTRFRGLRVRVRSRGIETWSDQTEIKLKPGIVPPRANHTPIEEGVLHCPAASNNPVVDMYYKKDDLVYGIQVTRSKHKRVVDYDVLSKYLTQLGINESNFVYVLCPGPEFWPKEPSIESSDQTAVRMDTSILSLNDKVKAAFWLIEGDYNK